MDTVPVLSTINYMPYFIQRAIIKGVQPIYNNEVFGILWDVDLALLLEIFRKDGTSYEFQLNLGFCFQDSETFPGFERTRCCTFRFYYNTK